MKQRNVEVPSEVTTRQRFVPNYRDAKYSRNYLPVEFLFLRSHEDSVETSSGLFISSSDMTSQQNPLATQHHTQCHDFNPDTQETNKNKEIISYDANRTVSA